MQDKRAVLTLVWHGSLLGSWIKPIRDATENRLMATSLAVTVVNLGVGAVSRIPAKNISVTADSDMDEVQLRILVLGANSLVIALHLGKITELMAFGSNGQLTNKLLNVPLKPHC